MAESTAGTATVAATTSPETATGAPPQPATESGKGKEQEGAPLKAPLIPDPQAFLERARARMGLPSRREVGEKPAASPAPVAPQSSDHSKPATQADAAAKPSEPSTDARPKTEPVDDLASRVAKFSREQRELAEQRKAFEQERSKAKAEREEVAKQHAAKLAQAETVERATTAIESGDIVGAIRALKSDANPSAFALQLLEQLQKEDERPMSAAEVDRIVAERLKAEAAAREKAEEEKRKADEEKKKSEGMATLEKARDGYMQACSAVFSKANHPFIAAHGLTRDEVIAYAESQRDETGRIVAPDPEELIKHFEEKLRKRAELAGWAPKAGQSPNPAPSASLNPSSLVSDSGGRVSPGEKPPSLDERRAMFRAKARALASQ